MTELHQHHVSDLNFDRGFAQQLSAAEQQRLATHLAHCPRCRERQNTLAAERAEFFTAAPSWPEYHAQHRSKVVSGKGKPALKLLVSLSAAAALAASVILAFQRGMPTDLPQSIRAKGGAQLGFYIKRGARVTRGRPDEVVHPGDVLRFTYSSSEPTYFALLGRDEHSAILFYPVAKETTQLPKGSDVPLGFGVEIDDQPGQERIYALFCSKPAQLSAIVTALDRTSELVAPDYCLVRELRLNKAVP